MTPTPLLDTVTRSQALRALPVAQLPQLCRELRQFLIESVAQTGGHLGASLGTVELTVALHYVYHLPHDQLVWDVGHQSYGHKILSGRRERMPSLRQWNGLAGFPKRDESEYDAFGVGHSSTSISAAVGMALANRQLQHDARVCAIIGDGAMTAGMAFEALNHGGDKQADCLVVLNDNDMSISPNVGALNQYLTRLLSSRPFQGARAQGKKVLQNTPLHDLAKRAEEHVKGMVAPSTLFEEFGFHYHGPVDGHDVLDLVEVLRNLRLLPGSQFLHVVTQKGKGYAHAESDDLALHAVTPFDPATGKAKKSSGGATGPTFTQVFSQWVCDQAQHDARLVAVTPAMREGSGLVEFERRFPGRYHDVGIAEQHAVTVAAGMACNGAKPVIAIYSTFLQRGYDQLVHDVSVQNLPVLFAIDRAGVVGPDGPTHAGSFDYSFLRCIPNLLIMAPADEAECRQMLSTGFAHDGPACVRYPRGKGPGATPSDTLDTLAIGRAQWRRRSDTAPAAVLCFGTVLALAEPVAQALDLALINMRFVKPLDTALLDDLAARYPLLICIEENVTAGGAGSGVMEYLAEGTHHPKVRLIGLPDRHQSQGSREELLLDAGLTTAQIEATIQSWL